MFLFVLGMLILITPYDEI